MFLNPAEFMPCSSITQICLRRGRKGGTGKRKKKQMETKEVSLSRCAVQNGAADGLHLERLYARFMSETEAD